MEEFKKQPQPLQPKEQTPEFDFNGEECKQTIETIDSRHTYFKLANTGVIFDGQFYLLNGQKMTLEELGKYADKKEEQEKDEIYNDETPEDKQRSQLYGQW